MASAGPCQDVQPSPFLIKKTRIKPDVSHANGIIYSATSKNEKLASKCNRKASKYFIPFTNAFAAKETIAPIVNPTKEDIDI